jgi:hypothetical protein
MHTAHAHPSRLRAWRLPRPSREQLAASLATVAVLATVTALDALRAAGLSGVQPRGGGAFRSLVTQLTDNAEWLILTAIGLFLTAAAGALIFGVRSAPDWLFKAGLGLLLLLVGVPAVLA